ncbi:Duffy receptor beta form [Liparis tanakae]|uniref:Duffy receptor beta form n=1 Tax=Liparis tanakae TaxID=230148 RepID=A0A4Z2HMK8_9TELE|nr:Duffy receptor beta form [Liparis tanakae]
MKRAADTYGWTSETGSDGIRPDQTDSDRIRPVQTGSDRIRPDQIGSDRIRPDQIGSDRIRSDQTGSDRFRAVQSGLRWRWEVKSLCAVEDPGGGNHGARIPSICPLDWVIQKKTERRWMS